MAYEKLALPVFNQYMNSKKPVGIIFIDADHLKYINDTGHDMGNLAISSIASVIRQHCPDNSVSMRYGGDEFVCVIPDYDQTQLQKLSKIFWIHYAFQKQPYGIPHRGKHRICGCR